MSEPKHTPGPWTSSLMDYHSKDPTGLVITGSDNNYICEIPNGDIKDADLALMLAAPDMYEALKCACDQYCIGYAGDSIVKCEDCIIGTALRKAREKEESE